MEAGIAYGLRAYGLRVDGLRGCALQSNHHIQLIVAGDRHCTKSLEGATGDHLAHREVPIRIVRVIALQHLCQRSNFSGGTIFLGCRYLYISILTFSNNRSGTIDNEGLAQTRVYKCVTHVW